MCECVGLLCTDCLSRLTTPVHLQRLHSSKLFVGCERWIGRMCPVLRYHPNTCLEGLMKRERNESKRSVGHVSNPGPSVYEASVLTTRPTFSMIVYARIMNVRT
jgi:hypothetical protein